jgi:MFS transporter, DHA3 family, macrolide efflux protein
MIDVTCLLIAVLALLAVHVPQPKRTAVGLASQGSLWKESIFGLHYILQRPSLLGLQLVFLLGNFATGIAFTLMAAMVLARTSNNSLVLGTVNSIGAAGGVIGGLLMSAWGGTKKKVHGVLIGWALTGIFGAMLMGLGQNAIIWAAAAFCGDLLGPWINGSNQAIWQAKVAPDVQGRVFSIRRLIAWFSTPLAALIAGPLADKVMEPAMQEGGALVPVFGGLVGTGPGAGMSVIFIFCGLVATLVGLGGYLIRTIRDAEEILPDHDETPVEAKMDPDANAGEKTVKKPEAAEM